MAIKILSTKDVHTNGVKLVLYGASGTGKTVMASTAPDPIFLSAEKGLLSLAHLDVPYIEVNNLKTIGEAYKYCVSSEHKTIVLDSLSEITSVVLDKHKKELVAASSTGKVDARQAYGKVAESIGNLIRNFRDIDGKNVIFIAKERKIQDEATGEVTFEAYMPGQVLPFDLPYLVDEVLCLQMTRKGERFIQTQPDFKRVCKDRSGKLANPEVADLAVIFAKIKGEK